MLGSEGHIINHVLVGFVGIESCSSSLGNKDPRAPSCFGCRLAGEGDVAWAGAGGWPRGETGSVPGWQLREVCVQLTGRWYSIGLASNSNWFKEKKHLMKMCTTVISVTADGNLEVTSTYPKYGHGEGGGRAGGAPPRCPAWGYVWAGASPTAPVTSSCCAPQG